MRLAPIAVAITFAITGCVDDANRCVAGFTYVDQYGYCAPDSAGDAGADSASNAPAADASAEVGDGGDAGDAAQRAVGHRRVVQRRRRLHRHRELLPQGPHGAADRPGHLLDSELHRRRVRQRLCVLQLLGGSQRGPHGVARPGLRPQRQRDHPGRVRMPVPVTPLATRKPIMNPTFERARRLHRPLVSVAALLAVAFAPLAAHAQTTPDAPAAPGPAPETRAPLTSPGPVPSSPAAPPTPVAEDKMAAQQAQIDALVAHGKDQDAQVAALQRAGRLGLGRVGEHRPVALLLGFSDLSFGGMDFDNDHALYKVQTPSKLTFFSSGINLYAKSEMTRTLSAFDRDAPHLSPERIFIRLAGADQRRLDDDPVGGQRQPRRHLDARPVLAAAVPARRPLHRARVHGMEADRLVRRARRAIPDSVRHLERGPRKPRAHRRRLPAVHELQHRAHLAARRRGVRRASTSPTTCASNTRSRCRTDAGPYDEYKDLDRHEGDSGAPEARLRRASRSRSASAATRTTTTTATRPDNLPSSSRLRSRSTACQRRPFGSYQRRVERRVRRDGRHRATPRSAFQRLRIIGEFASQTVLYDDRRTQVDRRATSSLVGVPHA